jgi:hypothetical protein
MRGFYDWLPFFATIALLIGLIAGFRVGQWLGYRWHLTHGDDDPKGVTAIEGAIFALMGLLIAFSFYGAAGRFEARRDMIRVEAAAISTAYDRIDFLRDEDQPQMRALFRAYLDARLSMFANVVNQETLDERLAMSRKLGRQIWRAADESVAKANSRLPAVTLLPAINEMRAAAMTRTVAIAAHPPWSIYVMLCLMATSCAILSGFHMQDRKLRGQVQVVIFCLALAMTFYITLDLESARFGLIRIDRADAILRDVRAGMDTDNVPASPSP